jgi:hypothetical protein
MPHAPRPTAVAGVRTLADSFHLLVPRCYQKALTPPPPVPQPQEAGLHGASVEGAQRQPWGPQRLLEGPGASAPGPKELAPQPPGHAPHTPLSVALSRGHATCQPLPVVLDHAMQLETTIPAPGGRTPRGLPRAHCVAADTPVGTDRQGGGIDKGHTGAAPWAGVQRPAQGPPARGRSAPKRL